MRRICPFLILALPFVLAPPPSYAQTAPGMTIDVIPSVGPESHGSGWNTYRANAVFALRNSLSAVGNPATDPGAYVALDEAITAPEMTYSWSVFHSWNGVANPLAPFNDEYGNRLYFGLRVLDGDGSQVKLRDLVYHLWSTDTGNSTPFFGLTYNFGLSNYSASQVGVQVGSDGLLGTLDDVILENGESGTTNVDALYIVGIGAGFSLGSGSSNQERLWATRDAVDAEAPFEVKMTYGVGSLTGNNWATSSVPVIATPEPATASFLVLSSLTLLCRRRK